MHPDCEAPSWPDAPSPICERHYIVIVRHYETVIRSDMDRRAENIGSFLDYERQHKPPTAIRATVYFVQLGDRIKIGFSGNVKNRMQAVPHERMLKVIDGTPVDERRWHERFAHLRVTGEWFRAEPELLAAIEAAPPAEQRKPRRLRR